MGRAPCCDKANVKRGPWSPEEDAKLKAYIEQHGTGGNWIALPQKIGLKRCGKSCRLRWLNYLRPNIKHGGFSEEEDNIICSLYVSIGSRWSIIAAQLPGRTDNDIKNYWNTRLKKKLLGRRKAKMDTNGLTIQESSAMTPFSNALSNPAALERLQLHVQLQRNYLQNPLSFYNSTNNNPSLLWPAKLHPFQEKMIQTLQYSMNNNTNIDPISGPMVQNTLLPSSSTPQKDHSVKLGTQRMEGGAILDDSMNNNIDSSSIAITYDGIEEFNDKIEVHDQVCALQGVMDDDNILDNNTTAASSDNYMPQLEEHISDEFGCLNGAKDSLLWWSNELEPKTASSTHVLQMDPWMFPDYEMGYM